MTTQNVEPLWSFYTGRGRSRELRPYWIKILRQILYCLNFCTAAPLKCLLFFWKEWIRKSVAIFCNYKTFKVVSFRTYRVKCICIFFLHFQFKRKVNFEKKKSVTSPSESSISYIHVHVLSRNTIMLQHLIIQFSHYYLSRFRLLEITNKRKFQTFSSKSGRGCLREVPNIVIWLANFWYFEKLIAEER